MMARVSACILGLLMAGLSLAMPAQAQWTEPTYNGSLRSAPLDPPPVTGTTFYVDINSLGGTCNNNNAGTSLGAPWCTLTKALTTLTAGQRAYVRSGTYAQGNIKPTNSGTAGNYITFEAYPGDPQPVINCTGVTWCFDMRTAAKSYLVFKGFEIFGATQQIMVCIGSQGCHHLWFVNNKIHNNGANFNGFEVTGNDVILSNNEIYNIGREGLITVSCPTTCEYGHHIIAEFNHVHDNGRQTDDAAALKCGDGHTSYACIFRYNHVHDNWRDPANPSSGCFNPGNCQGVAGLYFDQIVDDSHGTLSYIYNNIVYNNDMGIQIWDSQGSRVFNNLVYHNGFQPGTYTNHWGYGLIVDWNAVANVHVYNNTVYGNRNVGLMYGDNVPTSAIISRNNITMNNGTGLYMNSGSANSANLNYDLIANNSVDVRWNSTNYTTLANFLARGGNTTYLNAVGTAATFVSAGTTGSANFHLQSGSAGINQGTTPPLSFPWDLDNVSRPTGAAYDIGSYEFTTAASAGPTVAITQPTGGTTYATPATALSAANLNQLQGTAADDVGVTGVTWSCPTCTPTTSGTATCTPTCGAAATSVTWSVGSIGLSALAPNVITVTATDGDLQATTDTLTVTVLVTTLRIDAGGNGGAFSDGTYQADAFFSGGTALNRPGQAIAGTNDDALYASERYGTMTYTLPMQNGTYSVTLKFAEMNATAIGQRLFHVDIQGARVLTNFDIFAVAGANTALDQTFQTTVSDGTLTIVLTTVADNAEIVGIVAINQTATPAPVVLRLVR